MGLGDLASKAFNSSPADVVGGIKDAVGGVIDTGVTLATQNPISQGLGAAGSQTLDLASHNPLELAGMAYNASPKEMFGALPQTQGADAFMNSPLNPMQFGGGQ